MPPEPESSVTGAFQELYALAVSRPVSAALPMVIEPAVVLASTPLVPVIANVPVPPATPMVVLAV